jgi:hypothetical protein
MTTHAEPATHGGLSTTERTQAALAEHPASTPAELAVAAGLGRSTVTRTLAALERTGHAVREPGTQERPGRNPDRWTRTIHVEPPAGSTGKLRPGALDALVLNHLRSERSVPRGPGAVAKALDRSSGAVANCLTRLTTAGRLRQTSERPKRYVAIDG